MKELFLHFLAEIDMTGQTDFAVGSGFQIKFPLRFHLGWNRKKNNSGQEQ